jgi:flagellar basal body-associated protein FliL
MSQGSENQQNAKKKISTPLLTIVLITVCIIAAAVLLSVGLISL